VLPVDPDLAAKDERQAGYQEKAPYSSDGFAHFKSAPFCVSATPSGLATLARRARGPVTRERE
jgi:hypothetical protein